MDSPSLPTLSDGTAGGIEPGSLTFPYCRDWVDEFVLLTEAEIAGALRLVLRHHHLLIEGAAALGVAALLKHPERYKGRQVALVLSGARIDPATLREILSYGEERA